MRILSSILIVCAVLFAGGGAARAADYQILWHAPDYATMVDVGTMRQIPGGGRTAEVVDVARNGDIVTGYRHRLEVDCPGGRLRSIGAWQTMIVDEASYAELDRSSPAGRVQGWIGPVPGHASERLFQYMCRPILAQTAKALVRDSSPSEAVRAHSRQWCGDCDTALPKERWQAWRAAFDDMGLPKHQPLWQALLVKVGAIAGFFVGLWLITAVVSFLRPSRPGVVQAPPFIGTVGVLGLLLGGALFYVGLVTVLKQELYAYGMAAFFIPMGLLFLAWCFIFRVEMSDEGFVYRGGYTGRVSRWRWSDVEAVGIRGGARQVVLLRMTGGKIVKISMMSEGLDEFFPRLAEAKGWTEDGPNQPVTF